MLKVQNESVSECFTSGLANFKPQERHLTRSGLACEPHVCILVSIKGPVELTIRPLLKKYIRLIPPYKAEGNGFDFRWFNWNYSLISSFQPHYGPRIDSASNRNSEGKLTQLQAQLWPRGG
jgi:hypothetical protein